MRSASSFRQPPVERALRLGRPACGQGHPDHHELVGALDIEVVAVELESRRTVLRDDLDELTLP
jgi:hypothetical protein